MNEFFEDFYGFSGFGPAIQSIKPTAKELNFFEGKLPARLLEYWQDYSFCGWGEGIFWVVNPADYVDILATWLRDTPFDSTDNYYVIGRSAFGI